MMSRVCPLGHRSEPYPISTAALEGATNLLMLSGGPGARSWGRVDLAVCAICGVVWATDIPSSPAPAAEPR
jgi:hypothetical protein